MAKTQRTDEHRPSTIVPANYEYVTSYSVGVPDIYHAINVERVLAAQAIARDAGFAKFGSMGKCGVCGASYQYGDLWRHMTGELLHVGHECASKYDMLADRTEWELAHMREQKLATVRRATVRGAKRRQLLLDQHPGLEQALAYDHHITRDIAARLQSKGKISDAQIALLFKLVNQGQQKQARLEKQFTERHVDAPIGRVTFRGRIVSVKERDGFRGGVEYKATIKITDETGATWLAWSTVPSDIMRTHGQHHGFDRERASRAALVGRFVDVTATCTRSDRDAHFAFAKRPTWTLIDTTIPVPANKADQLAMLSTDYYLAIELLFSGVANLVNGLAGSAQRGIVGGI